MIEIWDGERWARSGTDSEGRFSFTVTKPAARAGRRRASTPSSSLGACSGTS